MSETKRIVCLANSRKLGGRCIAGKEVKNSEFGDWIRPVSSRLFEEVSEKERHYENGNEPDLLDIIDIPLLKHQPHDYQKENWLLDPNSKWSKVDKAEVDDLWNLVDSDATLWSNESSTQQGFYDRITEDNCKAIDSSLCFICIDNLKLIVYMTVGLFGNKKRRVQGLFQYDQTEYKLWVTDPKCEQIYLAKSDGVYELGKCFLTISLGNLHDEFAYKLIAAVIECKKMR